MIEIIQTDVFPLIRGGGLFLILAGISMLIGSMAFRARYPIFGIGAGAGGALTAYYARALAAPIGVPGEMQIVSLVVAVVLEVLLLIWALRRVTDERFAMLVILAIVGGHFVLMAPAFGPIVVILAGASVLNVLVALIWQSYKSATAWAVDGFLKTLAGGAMYLNLSVDALPLS